MKQQISSKLMEFTTLTTEIMSSADKANVLAALSKVQTLAEAKALAQKEHFACRDIDHQGRVKVITYRGVEILLMYRRMTSSVPLSESHGTPSFSLTNMDDVWLLVNLANISNQNTLKGLFQEIERLKNSLARHEALQASSDLLASSQTDSIAKLEERCNMLMQETKEVQKAANAKYEKLKKRYNELNANYKNLTIHSSGKITSRATPATKAKKKSVPKKSTPKKRASK